MVYQHEFTVASDAVDRNGHVNNVVYVQWMQDVAIRHSDAVGGSQAARRLGGTWVVRTHKVEYLKPAFAGDQIALLTWVADFRRVRSLRRYKFLRKSDDAVLANAETDWVFVDASTGQPRKVPEEVVRCYPIVPDAA